MATTAEPQSTSGTDENVVPQELRIVLVQLPAGPKFLDAHESANFDFNVVIRANQSNNTQRWLLKRTGAGFVTIQQISTGRYLDAYETGAGQFRVVTRRKQNDDTQRWRLIGFGGQVFKIQQASSNRVLEATSFSDSQVVTRPEGGTDLQVWRIDDAELIAE